MKDNCLCQVILGNAYAGFESFNNKVTVSVTLWQSFVRER